ncbi:MAG: tetrahydromethanopterin S-methyltransferase subunit A [Candidatus Altiarchaeota archaeon]|nr:tetrahydromethanopterin S-methyltransferase subunit A [Candidatus Altiarchaeota archaeon]
MTKLYPWGGKMEFGNEESCVALVTLSDRMDFSREKVAVYGSMKTENLGVEKVVANVISNPRIRFLIVCGNEVRGHRSGDSILSLHRSGVDESNRVVGAKSAIPYIENLPRGAIDRFRTQVDVVDLIDVTDEARILSVIDECLSRNPGSFGEPFIVEQVAKEQRREVLHTDFALHAGIDLDEYGVVSRPCGVD